MDQVWPRGEEKSAQTYAQALKVQSVAGIKTGNGDQEKTEVSVDWKGEGDQGSQVRVSPFAVQEQSLPAELVNGASAAADRLRR